MESTFFFSFPLIFLPPHETLVDLNHKHQNQIPRPLLDAPVRRQGHRRGDGLGRQAMGRHSVLRALVRRFSRPSLFLLPRLPRKEKHLKTQNFPPKIKKQKNLSSSFFSFLAGPTGKEASPASGPAWPSTSTRCSPTGGCLSSRAVSLWFFSFFSIDFERRIERKLTFFPPFSP